MANLKVGTGLTFDGGTGNVTSTGIITTRGSGNIGVNTTNVNAQSLTGVGKSFHGIYIDDGFIAFKNKLDNVSGYYIATHVNGLNAGPVTLGSTMTLAGTWVIV